MGGALRHPKFGSGGFWMVATYTCFALGLIAGQILAYCVHRESITAT